MRFGLLTGPRRNDQTDFHLRRRADKIYGRKPA
jgi:hypothetical protein